jgi:hypothetical protein
MSSDETPKGTAQQPLDDHSVGYGKPPEQTKFKKGQSGNSAGRPTNEKDFGSVAWSRLDNTRRYGCWKQ